MTRDSISVSKAMQIDLRCLTRSHGDLKGLVKITLKTLEKRIGVVKNLIEAYQENIANFAEDYSKLKSKLDYRVKRR
jgi:hypothetical protein